MPEPNRMKAVGYKIPGSLERQDALLDLEIAPPSPGSRDLLVAVAAISVNPVDTKIRRSTPAPEGAFKILGWDVSGRVEAVGDAVSGFKPGDQVFYSGTITRPGANSAFHLVDERLAGHAPKSLSHAEAAAFGFLQQHRGDQGRNDHQVNYDSDSLHLRPSITNQRRRDPAALRGLRGLKLARCYTIERGIVTPGTGPRGIIARAPPGR